MRNRGAGKKMKIRKSSLMFAVVSLTAFGSAHATEGYFSHGYGLKASGRGGVAQAFTDDAFGGANNPASFVWVGNRLDVGATEFLPERGASRTGSARAFGPQDPGRDYSETSDRKYFTIPEFGYSHVLNGNLSAGVSVYGNGELNTNFHDNAVNGFCPQGPGIYNALCGQGRLGVNLTQLVIAPALSWRFTTRQSVGIAPLIGIQQFKATGLQAFTGLSSNPAEVTNNGYDYSYGAGVRVGYLARPTDWLSVGASYSSRIYVTRFKDYGGLFARNGRFDIPSNFAAGVAIKPNKMVTVGFDYQRINYSDVAAVHNPSSNQAPLGSGAGPGFGWQSVNAYKVGLEMQPIEELTLRAGYNHSGNPLRSGDVTFNILAPGLINDHVTAGLTYKATPANEWTLMYLHAFENSLSGPSLFLGGNERIHLSEDAFGLAYAHKF
jgi:long-chain fatty acid transport protein